MLKDYKLMVADVDATLRWYGTNPGPLTLSAFRQMHKQGILLGIASGRPLWEELESHAADWGLDFQFDLIIGMNGGEILDTRKNTKEILNPLSRETIKEIITKMEIMGVKPSIYLEGCTMALEMNDMLKRSRERHNHQVIIADDVSEFWREPNLKIMYRCPDAETASKVEAFGHSISNDRYCCFRTGTIMVEFQDPRNSKGAAIRKYCEDNNIRQIEIMAFGDAENDIEMLKYAGTGISVANGLPEVKAISSDVTRFDAAHDGVGDYLYQQFGL